MKLSITPERTCGTCTKCCEGTLHGAVNGVPFYKGMPCTHCVPSQGCSIYEERPEDPCKKFKCSWLTDYSVPEWMKPNLSGAIVHERNTKSFSFPILMPNAEDVSVNTLSWYLLWALPKYGCAVWFNSAGSRFYLGSPEFGAELDELESIGPRLM